MMAGLAEVEAACAICGAPPVPECPHESERLELALNQAMYRWSGFNKVRRIRAVSEWVLDRARDSVLATFAEMKRARYQAHVAYLHTLPCFSLYQKFRGHPPLNPSLLQSLEAQIHSAREMYTSGVNDDWRRSCMTYPEVLDYFFALVDIDWPDERDIAVQRWKSGGVAKDPKRIKARRGSRESRDGSTGRRRRDRRRHSRGRTPHR